MKSWLYEAFIDHNPNLSASFPESQSKEELIEMIDNLKYGSSPDSRMNSWRQLERLRSVEFLPTLWDYHQQDPYNYLREAIQTLQNKHKIYNYKISQTLHPLPPEHSTPNLTISGCSFGDLILGNKQTIVENRS